LELLGVALRVPVSYSSDIHCSIDTPRGLKLIDAYMVYILLTGIIQFVYVSIAGTFPNNAFLAGFISTVAGFVLAGA
jgi:hypothetical protein